MENFKFDPEASALRTELVGNLKIDRHSGESRRLLETWAEKGERLVESGALDRFAWHHEEAEVYLEADAMEEAIWVLKTALYEAIHEGRPEEISYFSDQLRMLGENPDDLSEFEA
jgi:hypothetical protein